MTLAFAAAKAPRLTLTRVSDGRVFEARFNPAELEEIIAANYARQAVPGLSHEVLQFVHTQNAKYEMDLFFEDVNLGVGDSASVLAARRFLRSLVYPRAAGGLVGGGAPRVLLTWPGFVSIACVLTNARFRYQRMNRLGAPCAMTANVTLEQIRDVLRLSEEVEGLENE